jgi:putative membrane protein
MRGLLIRFVVIALALGATSYIVPGIHVGSIPALAAAALVLGVLNAIIRPIVLLLTLPINLVTLGLFTFVINAAMLKLTSVLMKNRGFAIDGYWPALIGAVVLAVISGLLNWLVKDAREKRRGDD